MSRHPSNSRNSKTGHKLKVISKSSPLDDAIKLGMSTKYLFSRNSDADPNLSTSIGIPDVYYPLASNPEEQFREFVVRGEGYAQALHRSLVPNDMQKHRQYGSLLDQSEEIGLIYEKYCREKKASKEGKTRYGLISFLKSNVRPLGVKQQRWMEELSCGKPLDELLQGGIALTSWTSSKESITPLLDLLALHKPPFGRATWYIKVNVLYTELNALSHDSRHKYGDWSYDALRFEKRAKKWTTQLMIFIQKTIRKSTSTRSNTISSEKEYRTAREQWLYIIQLAQWQFEAGLLDTNVYFDGWMELLSSMREGAFPLEMEDCFVILSTIMHHLSPLFRSGTHVRSLVKSLLTNVAQFCPDRKDKVPRSHRYTKPSFLPPTSFASPRHEHLFQTLCELLRSTLINAPDALVRVDAELSDWPPFLWNVDYCLTQKRTSNDSLAYVNRCRVMKEEITRRIFRLRASCLNYYSPPAKYNEVEVIDTLDKFHEVGGNVDMGKTYSKIFYTGPLYCIEQETIPVDSWAVFLICEWAVTSERISRYRVLSASYLLESYNDRLQVDLQSSTDSDSKKRKKREMLLQDAVHEFLVCFQPKNIDELQSTIQLIGRLVCRRLFSVVHFMRSLVASGVIDPGNSDKTSSKRGSEVYEVETGPGRGISHDNLRFMSTYDKCMMYLWQLPRGSHPHPEAFAIRKRPEMSNSLVLNQWLLILGYNKAQVLASVALSGAQRSVLYAFCLYDTSSPGDSHDTINVELMRLSYWDQVLNRVKLLSEHDKGCLAQWLLDIATGSLSYKPNLFFSVEASQAVCMEDVMRWLLYLFEKLDISLTMRFIEWMISNACTELLVTSILPLLPRLDRAFHSARRVPRLLQTFVTRFNRTGCKNDDEVGRIVKAFCEIYYLHRGRNADFNMDVAELPHLLLMGIASDSRKTSKKDEVTKDGAVDTLEDTTKAIARTPKFADSPPPEMQKALDKMMRVLQSGGRPTSLQTHLCKISTMESECIDSGVLGASQCIKNFTNKHNEHVFLFRALLMEVMEKWVEAAARHQCLERAGPLHTPLFLHRAARLLRQILHNKETGPSSGSSRNVRDSVACKADLADRDMFSRSVLTWLFREVVPAFAGTEKNGVGMSNPYVPQFNANEAFVTNQKGKLNVYQCGIRAFIQSLMCHQIIPLDQFIRVVIVPGLPQRKQTGSASIAPGLGSQLLTMTLLSSLLSDDPAQEEKSPRYDDPWVSTYMRFLRTRVPLSIVFPLLVRLCKIAYQLDKTFQLRKRDERGHVAATVFFSLTADLILREILLFKTAEFSDKYLKPLFQDSQWYAAVLLCQLWRLPKEPGDDKDGRVKLCKPEEVLDRISVWNVNRGGWVLLNVQLERQQVKINQNKKRNATSGSRRTPLPSPILPPQPPTPPPLPPQSPPPPSLSPPGSMQSFATGGYSPPPLPAPIGSSTPSFAPLPPSVLPADIPLPGTNSNTPTSMLKPGAPPPLGDMDMEDECELGMEPDFGEAKDSTESLAHMVILRILKPTSRASRAPTPLTIASRSPMMSPPGSYLFSPSPLTTTSSNPTPEMKTAPATGNGPVLDTIEETMQETKRPFTQLTKTEQRCEEVAYANLYAAMINQFTRRAPIATLVEIHELLRKDVLQITTKAFVDAVPLLVFCRGLLSHENAKNHVHMNTHISMFTNGLIDQFQVLLEACRKFDANPRLFRESFMVRLHEKLTMRLQLMGLVAGHLRKSTDGSPDRLARVLLSLTTTNVVQVSGQADLFSRILDSFQLFDPRIMEERHSELLSSLILNDELKRRVEAIFPKMQPGISPILIPEIYPHKSSTASETETTVSSSVSSSLYVRLDPWTVVQQVSEAPSAPSLLGECRKSTKKPRRFYAT